MKDFRVFRIVSYDFRTVYRLDNKNYTNCENDLMEIVFANNTPNKRVSVGNGKDLIFYKDLPHAAAWDEWMVLCSMTDQKFTPGYFERNKYTKVG